MKLLFFVLINFFSILICLGVNEQKKDSIDIVISSLNVKISNITISEGNHSEAFPLIDSALILGYSNKRYQKISPIVANYSILLNRDGFPFKAKMCINRLMPFHNEMDSMYYGILLSKRGIIHVGLGDLDSAKTDILLSIEILKTSKQKILLADSYYSLSKINHSELDIYNSVDNLRKASEIYFELNYNYAGNVCMEAMARMLSRMDLYNEALEVLYKLKNRSEGVEELIVCTSLLDVYDKLELEETEKQIVKESLELYEMNYDSLKTFQKLEVDGRFLWYYLNIDSLELANDFFEKVINNELYNSKYKKSFEVESEVFMYYIKTKNKEKATEIYNRYVNVSEENYSRGIYDLLNMYVVLIEDDKLQNEMLKKSLDFHKDENRKIQNGKIAYLYAKHETEKKENAIRLQKSEISVLEAENTNKTRAIGFSVVFGLVIAGFLFMRSRMYKLQKNGLKNKNLLIESEKKQLNLQLVSREKELSDFALHLSQKNEAIEKLKDKVEIGLEKEMHKDEILSLFSQEQFQDESWSNLQERFSKIHASFFENLRLNFPNLTSAEEKLCVLIKLGMSSKEIANIVLISPKSVDQKKYRLKKKINDESKMSLTELLSNL